MNFFQHDHASRPTDRDDPLAIEVTSNGHKSGTDTLIKGDDISDGSSQLCAVMRVDVTLNTSLNALSFSSVKYGVSRPTFMRREQLGRALGLC